jgi:toxin ParE1/3/4
MTRIIIAPAAASDTRDILIDLADKAGSQVAAKYAGLFEHLYDCLELFPASGAPRPALGKDVRIGIVDPYIVLYRHTMTIDAVTVLRIVHGRRRITKALLRPRFEPN